MFIYIRDCQVCQIAKSSHSLPFGLLQPLPIADKIWENIVVDFMTGLPLANGYLCLSLWLLIIYSNMLTLFP